MGRKSKFKQVCEPLHLEAMKIKHPSVPEHAIPKFDITGTSTNKLEKSIVAYIMLHGWLAERIKNTGTARVQTMKMANGYEKKKLTYTKSTGEKGTADILATIDGRKVSIEVKNVKTKDRMSDAQRAYKRKTELSGGVYYVARTIEQFMHWYEEQGFGMNPNWEEAIKMLYKK